MVISVAATLVPDVGRLLAAIDAARAGDSDSISPRSEALVVELFHTEGRSLVRLARLFVDDRDAAEDIVQEAFLRLARHAGRIEAADRAPAYLRSIVLNLARDHNRRGLVSLRHHAAAGGRWTWTIDVADDLGRDRGSAPRARRRAPACPPASATASRCATSRSCRSPRSPTTLDLSANSVKTHLQRAMAALDRTLGAT